MSDLHDGFVKLFTRRSTGVVVGGVVVAPGASELVLPIALAVTKGLTVVRPGADVRDLPVAVGLDHRGRPPADGRRRARLTSPTRGPVGSAAPGGTDVTRTSAQLRADGADGPRSRRCSRGCLPSRACRPPPVADVLPLAAVVAAVACRRSAARTVAVADEPAGTTVVGELVQAWPEASTATHAAARRGAERRSAGSRPPSGDAVRGRRPRTSPTCPAGSTGRGHRRRAGGTTRGRRRRTRSRRRGARGTDVSGRPPRRPGAGSTNEVTVVMVAPAGVHARTRATRQHGRRPRRRTGRRLLGRADRRRGRRRRHGRRTTGSATARRLRDAAAAVERGRREVGFVARTRQAPAALRPAGRADGCAYALGRGRLVADLAAAALYVRDAVPSVIAHELGHNFGLGHSSGQQCDGTPSRPAGAAAPSATATTTTSWASRGRRLGSLNVAPGRRPRRAPARRPVQPVSVYGTAGSRDPGAAVRPRPASARSG